MAVKNYTFTLTTDGHTEIKDITDTVLKHIEMSRLKDGIVLVFCAGSTCGLTTIEYESGCVKDLKEFYEQIAPSSKEYKHNLKWGDGNGYAHLRSAITNGSYSFPLVNGKAVLGPWQQIIFLDFDNRGRDRKIFVQIVGE